MDDVNGRIHHWLYDWLNSGGADRRIAMSEEQAQAVHEACTIVLAVAVWSCIAYSLLMIALKPYEMELKQPCTEQTK